ncbi:hypothetical protein I3843_11G159100 [Carya illinoinensis]|uniref:Transcription factor GTE4-like n=1 Tax=Carya illinoinensis TaxID=32201 RepID=A0A922DR12_CARIL|nr:hypothetical protein I3760_11G158200 [Carya illinoinensis]KAG2681757.1 hypothetical protein I3760_11G158200 [Carya illinoinensis]KAG2681758.1 hypothetical protein I3760_11G158200 [Carya illinoinensis]KAG2681759.1 hypothetical protein I3760_11G158200 [Carya illinoinensis]KAG2681760.1 hypothetical protein I3760_11G158200 [Carya illinoinensis]
MASGLLRDDEAREKKRRWEESSKVYSRKNHKKPKNYGNATQLSPSQTLATTTEDNNSSQPPWTFDSVASDDSSSQNLHEPVSQSCRELAKGNGLPDYARFENRVRISVKSRSKSEVRELRRKLASELDHVRSLMKKLEVVVDKVGTAMRVNSEAGSNSKPFRSLTVSAAEKNEQPIGESAVKEKKTPKANKDNQNLGLVSGKETKKKLKSNGGKRDGGGEMGLGFGKDWYLSPVFKSCADLLSKLMKHKFGWVFNKPVDVKGLGLRDYHTIVKHPMDLGTVKNRLNKNWYKSPREFAEDVRLAFNNAMLYNPKGQDVHFMAEQLSKTFEEQWKPIESEFIRSRRIEMDHDAGLPTPTSRKAPMLARAPALPPVPAPPPVETRTSEIVESKTMPVEPKLKPASHSQLVRTPVPKKPKAKDPDKRDMTYEEKQRLSLNLQSLPSEKLDNIVQIIKRRNPGLFQQDDEIEVDIASVDPETLWELDRFVTNYKKSLSKNKRKTEIALQSEAETDNATQETNLAPAVAEAPKETEAVENNVTKFIPVQGEKQGDNVSGSSSSSSSGSESGSSSNDSHSDGSSATGSDAH